MTEITGSSIQHGQNPGSVDTGAEKKNITKEAKQKYRDLKEKAVSLPHFSLIPP